MERRLGVVCFACRMGIQRMVRRSEPPFFAHVTIRWHHVTGSPTGTCSKTPSRTSQSFNIFLPVQWDWSDVLVWGSSGPSMRGSSQVFTGVKCACLVMSSVAGYGSSVSFVGGSVRRWHGHGLGVSGCGVSVATSVACVAVGWWGIRLPGPCKPPC